MPFFRDRFAGPRRSSVAASPQGSAREEKSSLAQRLFALTAAGRPRWTPRDYGALAMSGRSDTAPQAIAIEGYASVFWAPDQGDDVVAKGAFAESLALKPPPRVAMLHQHDPSAVVGVWDEVKEDAHGLVVRGRILPDTPAGRLCAALVKTGVLAGLSIGFRTRRARSDPERKLRVLTRISPWSNGRRRYLIGQSIRALDDAAALVAFFEARRGRLQGFRFRDFADFKSCAPSAQPGPLDQPVARFSDGSFQLTKAYGADDDVYLRPIAKPVVGSVRVAADGVELSPTAFDTDPATGLVAFAAPPGAGAVLTAGFLFDTPVRFDADRIDVSLEGLDAGRVVAVPLIEVRL